MFDLLAPWRVKTLALHVGMPHELGDTLAQLQRLANHCAWLFQTNQTRIEYRIVYTTGVRHPWRLIETHHKKAEGPVLRRVHCFSECDALRRCIAERAQWKRCDRALVAAEIPGTGMVLASAPDTAYHEGMEISLVPLEERRRELREQICVTQPDWVVQLPLKPRGRRSRGQPAPGHV